MAETITDLTGYTWVGNDIISLKQTSSYFINFINNDTNYLYLHIENMEGSLGMLYYSLSDDWITQGTIVFDYTLKWTGDSYKTIQITGGTDATNTQLIAWLQANGTLTKGSTKLESPTLTLKSNTGTNYTIEVSNPNSVLCAFYSQDLLDDYGGSIDVPANGTNTFTLTWASTATTHTVSGYLQANDYENSDTVSISVTRPLSIEKGKYRSNNDISFTFPTSEITQSFNFTSNGHQCTGMRITSDTLYYVESNGNEIEVYNSVNKWNQEDIKYSVIQVLNTSEVTSEFYTYFNNLFVNVETLEYTLHVKIGSTTYDSYTPKLKIGGTTYEIN